MAPAERSTFFIGVDLTGVLFQRRLPPARSVCGPAHRQSDASAAPSSESVFSLGGIGLPEHRGEIEPLGLPVIDRASLSSNRTGRSDRRTCEAQLGHHSRTSSAMKKK
jgi:hypothetical protein